MNVRGSNGLVPLLVAAFAACSSGSGHPPMAAVDAGTDAGADAADAAAEAGVDPDRIDDDLPLPLAAGVAPTPPMGWNSWNSFATNVNATVIEKTADIMVSSGMQAAGYQYVNIDDGWAIRLTDVNTGQPLTLRDPSGNIFVDPVNFPNGIAPVADYVHNLGLKLGIYSDRGTATCSSREGSQGYEMQDSASYAAWGVDYVKYDNCNATLDIQTQYTTMGADLFATGRPFVYSLCAWQFYEWGIGLGQMWRTTSDIVASWTAASGGSVFGNLISNRSFAAYSGPMRYMAQPAAGSPPGTPSTPDGAAYGFNDPDMLEVGRQGLSDAENQSHFSTWAISAAPLIAGNDLRIMTLATQTILTNAEVIAIDQDPLGLQGFPVVASDDTNQTVWAKPLNQSGARAVVLLNGGAAPADIAFHLADIGLGPGTAAVRDLVAHQDLAPIADGYTASQVPPHGSVTLKVTGVEPARPHGTAFLSDLTWTYAANGLGAIHRDESNTVAVGASGTPITLRANTYTKGLGVDGPSSVIFRLAQKCHTFTADVGVDDAAKGYGSVVFQVWSDGSKLFDSGVVTGMSPVQNVNVPLDGKRRLILYVTNAGDGPALDRADWANAQVVCDP